MSDKALEKVLLVEDNLGDARLFRELYDANGSRETDIVHVQTMESAEAFLAQHSVDIVLLDLALPDAAGLESVRRARAAAPHTPLVVLTGRDDESLAVQALQEGAQDYLIKGQLETRRLLRALRYAMERSVLEEQLLESAREYRILFHSNPHPMWVFDAQTLGFLAVNDAAVRLYGFSTEEFLGMTIREIRPPEDVPALVDYLESIPDTPSLVAIHIRHRKKDGTLLEVAGVSNPIVFRGRKARLVMANDVSEKKRLEAELLQAQKMEAVGRLAGGVAHDFNNLLGVITGYSELLMGDLGAEHPGAKAVEEIQKAAVRAASLTRQLLAFSRKQVLLPRILELDGVVAEVEKMLRRLIGADIQLVTAPGPELGRIRADPGQLEQVLMNLVVNARDAMPRGGKVTIETANVELDNGFVSLHPEIQPGPFVMLSVSDTGFGMDIETQAHIFEPFFTTKEEGRGTGLGLSTVFGIVQQSGGTLSVESQPGVGTTFRLYFPRVAGEPSRDFHAAVETRPPLGTELVMLVEDAEALRVMIHKVLEASGYSVLEFSDPEEALASLGTLEVPIRLLLTDVVMPGMSGTELAASVRRARPGMRVLFMSGYTDADAGLAGALGAGTQFLQKPFSMDALRRKVREVLDGPAGPGQDWPARSGPARSASDRGFDPPARRAQTAERGRAG